MVNSDACVVDEYGNVHRLKSEIGRGGQGVVFRTQDHDVAVKLAMAEDGSPEPVDAFAAMVRKIRSRPMPPGIHLAAPIALLAGQAGYVMRLLNGMIPISRLMRSKPIPEDPGNPIPGWLAGASPEAAGKLLQYAESGGARRRLMRLFKCASVLARLHASGFVYGDISPSNVFVSADPEDNEVWLIDADNVRYDNQSPRAMIYTPGYGAPEVVRREVGVSSLSDRHAFAVLAFRLLILVHPFEGAYVEGSGDRDWADDDATNLLDPKDEAYAGLVPWIDDPHDQSNQAAGGLPRDLILTPELKHLCQQAFGPGRKRPECRPSMFHWPPALAAAHDISVRCPVCWMTYYLGKPEEPKRCPFCGAAIPPCLRVDAFRLKKSAMSEAGPSWRIVRELPSTEESVAYLPRRLVESFCLRRSDEAVLSLRILPDAIEVAIEDEELVGKITVAEDYGAPGTERSIFGRAVFKTSRFALRVGTQVLLRFTCEGWGDHAD